MMGERLSDASRKTDVVVVAARYDHGSGQVQSVQAYVRRGSVWGDIVLLDRRTLIGYMKTRRRVVTGRPKDVPGDFDIGAPLRTLRMNGTEALIAEGRPSGKDDLGVPLF
ncbi:MAG: hypothetical protein M1337_07600 [Actinobacteria bacterium]|nr:hypothetical protein [Actinomycetota bacterium]